MSKNRNDTTRLFWCHPKLMDYRIPLFNRVTSIYDVNFFFQEKNRYLPMQYKGTFGRKGIANRGLSSYDFPIIYKGVKTADIVISSFFESYYTMLCFVICKILGKKIIIWEELSEFHTTLRAQFKYAVIRYLARHIDAFFVLGENHRCALQKLGVPADKVFCANEYPGYKYFEIDGKKIEGLNIEGYDIILYMGRFVAIKGIDILIRAFSRLEKQYSNILLLLVGGGPQEKELKQLVENLRIRNVKFLPLVRDIAAKKYLFESSCMLVAPSRVIPNEVVDAGPMIILEALSSGTPVIATIGEHTRYIINEINGYIVPHSDENALFEKMEKVMHWANRHEIRKKITDLFLKIPDQEYQLKKIQEAITKCLR